ncbi:HNH endonuclease [Paenibacillus cremeus]|uniref:HNH endonuclease n=1 Tax=Paenibacillus cremeus TaxID=2163881 RepID=A0A559KCM9_9BACL|nr:HNH endonuclease [Paenibacillus cremeus]TVY09887.1 HNH endonuclease [Paenibacillus cremeus]
MEYKLCNTCLQWFPCNSEYYYKNKQNKMDGYNAYCKECTIKKSKLWQKENPEQYKKLKEKHNANRPENQVVSTRLSSKRRLKDGRHKEWQQSERGKLAHKKSRERRKAKKHIISKEEWTKCKLYFDDSCAYCGLHISEHFIKYAGEFKWTDLHKEHVDDNGANDLSNCIPSCKNCNSQKWEFDLDEWYNEHNPFFTYERLLKINKWLNGDCYIHID